jgi:HEAT repeat protein
MMNVSGDLNLLVEEVVKDHRKLRNIISLLYDEDMTRRFTAAKALGEVARREPELMKQRWERIFRAFDDTMSCWGAAEALAEVARNLPQQQRGKIIPFLRGFRKDECSCQGYIWGMCRICQVDRDRIKDFIPELEGFLKSPDVCLRGQALWALGELGTKEMTERIKDSLRDERKTWVYENDSVSRKNIRTIAEEALRKMEIEKSI